MITIILLAFYIIAYIVCYSETMKSVDKSDILSVRFEEMGIGVKLLVWLFVVIMSIGVVFTISGNFGEMPKIISYAVCVINIVAVNYIQYRVQSFVEKEEEQKNSSLSFPYLCKVNLRLIFIVVMFFCPSLR